MAAAVPEKLARRVCGLITGIIMPEFHDNIVPLYVELTVDAIVCFMSQ